jgi:glycosyltransferase involved in cell wall biosynthesis
MELASENSWRSMPPRLTVIIPTYNRERYLGEAIASVLGQTFTAFELIVVDDGSTDRTATLVNAIEDPRLRYVAQPHRGLSAALNRGLHNSRGQYIARLDSDDVYLPEALATLISATEKAPTPSVIWARGQVMDEYGRVQPRTRGSRERFPGEMLRSLIYEDCTTSPAMLIPKDCFARVGEYDEALAFSEDWDMALRLAQHYPFRFVDKVVVHIREHREAMTARNSSTLAGFINTRTVPLDKLFSDPNLPPDIAAMKRMSYSNLHIFCGRMWIYAGEFRKASHEFVRALATSDQPISTACAIVWRIVIAQILERGVTVTTRLGEFLTRNERGRRIVG